MKSMMGDSTFLVKGSRPPSAASSTDVIRSSKRNGYHTVARTSFTDESLFGGGNQSKINEPMKPFKAPWDCPKPITPGHTYSSVRHFKAVLASNKENPKKKPPLLWAPEPGVSKFSRPTKNSSNESLKPNLKNESKNCFWNTRSHFRHLKHTPTFVDESLFGPKLEEPSFEAPWNDCPSINNVISNKEKRKQLSSTNLRKPYLWDPSGDSRIQTHNGLEINLGAMERPKSSQRPKSAIGISRSDPRPHWKP